MPTTPAYTLTLVQGATSWTFYVHPVLAARRLCRFKEAAEPPEVVEAVDTWELRDAWMVSSDGTQATLHTEASTLLGLVGSRASPFTSATIKDSSGNPLRTLATGSGYEQIRIEDMVLGEPTRYPGLEAGTWKSGVSCSLTISAVLPQADSNGVTFWDQVVSYTYNEAGLLRITWQTEVGVARGTSGGARGKLATLGLIPVATWGDSYRYITNGDAGTPGVDVEELDADEANSWEASRARGTCVLEQTGVTVGTTAPGLFPTSVSLETRLETTKDQTLRVTTASAVGPGAEAWCRSQVPLGVAPDKVVEIGEPAGRSFLMQWEQAVKGTGDNGGSRTIRVQLSGGHPEPQFEPAAGGYDPVEFTTARLPFTVVVEVSLEGVGTSNPTEMLFPPLLGDPFRLIPSASAEDMLPVAQEGNKTPDATRYRRDARLVYQCARKPADTFATTLRQAPPEVVTYGLAVFAFPPAQLGA